MATSGTVTFDLDLTELVEEAFERAGAELRSGYDLRTARRSLNLMLIEWQNRGLNMWTIDSGEIPLVAGTATYDLPLDTVDLLDYVIRTGSGQTQTDLSISRIGVSQYARITNKLTSGRPTQVYVNRRTGAEGLGNEISYPTVTFYPLPDNVSTYTFVYWRMRRMQDATVGPGTQDIPFRFLPVLTAGLAYYLSQKIPGSNVRTPELKAMYEEQWQLAADEDREKTPLRLVPRIL